MNVFAITGIALVAAMFGTLLKSRAPEFALALSLVSGTVILGMVLIGGVPLFEELRSMFSGTGTQAEYAQILFKALGICFVVQIACDACRDLGESAIATKLELAGKFSVLLISLPLFERILQIVGSLIG